MGKEIRAEDGDMSDLISMIAMTPISGALVVLALLMALRVARALQSEHENSRQRFGRRTRPRGV